MRSTLAELADALGPNRQILAHLDDIFILSTDNSAQEEAERFLESKEDILKVNAQKSKTYPLSVTIGNGDGIEVLGTIIGPKAVREEFLQSKIDAMSADLELLTKLNHQSAWLLLPKCVQQDLRHLQRTLLTNDMGETWDKADGAIWNEAKRLRNRQVKDTRTERETAQRVASLPVRLGGLGPSSTAKYPSRRGKRP